MVIRKVNPIRGFVRNIIAAYVWLSPAFSLARFHLPARLTPIYHQFSPDVILLIVIAYYSLLSDGGWLSLAWDCCYVWGWPLVALWYLLKRIVVKGYRALATSSFYEDITEKTSNSTIQVAASVDLPHHQPCRSSMKSYIFGTGRFARLFRPLTQFMLLWTLLLLNTNSKTLAFVAVLVVVIGFIKVSRNLVAFTSETGSWITKLKTNFETQIADNLEKIRAHKPDDDPNLIRGVANVLRGYESIFRNMSEKQERVLLWTTTASLVFTIIFYIYLSFIFTSIYLSLSRLSGVNWAWQEILTTSMFIPFTFTDLPHNIWIRLVGGIQTFIVTGLGYTFFFRRLRSNVDLLAKTASELQGSLSDPELKATLTLLAKTPASRPLTETKKPPQATRPKARSRQSGRFS